ncbi:hypothetical protein BDV26DRAFT_69171 [Aspergillus bertholletiae]|uniref:Zn(2)-C6 fungal-type domain-containing protein n=1 Tax=Aspergillus bertholletiae TaxID=1226010 RepID=A0A5N7AX38_9EURO|nr:hypothetical protein BDV26DRAFT_69171 [Aspergillus bertholletiae]
MLATDVSHPTTGSQRPAKKPRRVKGCYNCSQRRLNCDRGNPCQKCVKKGLHCSGLGVRYRFINGVAPLIRLSGAVNSLVQQFWRTTCRPTAGQVHRCR